MTDRTAEKLWDIHEIEQIYLTYAISMDSHSWDLMSECFVPDARIELGALASKVANATLVDLAGWRAICEKTDQTFDMIQHYLYQPLIRLEGHSASTRVYFAAQHALNALAPKPFFTLGGWYDGKLAKVDGRWRITRHKIVETWLDGNPQVVLGLDLDIGAVPRGKEHGAPAWVG